MDALDRFADKARRREGDCFLWTGDLTAEGYGRFSLNGSSVYAHRFSYEQLVGPIPEGLELDHTCHSNDPTCEGGVTCLHRRCA